MGWTRAEIIAAIDEGLFFHPVPGLLKPLSIPGVTGCYAPGLVKDQSFLNRVGRARLTDEHVDETIAAIIAQFDNQGQDLMWFVIETNTPIDIGRRLEQAGLPPLLDMAGMALANLNQPIPVNPAVRVERASPAQRALVVDLHEQAFPLKRGSANRYADVITGGGGQHYIAFLNETDEAVGVASMLPLPDRQVVVLETAAVLEAYRGRGIYKALVASRLAAAREMGLEAAVTHAFRDSSTPILQKLGFQEFCPIHLHWSGSDQS